MITNNPYNLPDKILKQNQPAKPIALQNKKSRDRSQQYSKQLSSKGIKLESQMKKSIHIQHVTSSPNLHTPPTSTSSSRQIDHQNISRPIEYHQTHFVQINETQNEKRMKFLYQKFYQINQQLNNHDSIINKLVNKKQKTERNSWDSPLQLHSHRESRQKDDGIRNQGRSFHSNQGSGYQSVSMNAIETNSVNREIEQMKKEINSLKQQITSIKIGITREKQQQAHLTGTNKSIKLNGNYQHDGTNVQRKLQQDITILYQTIQHIKLSNNEKINLFQNIFQKIQANTQLLGHKVNKAQQRIDNLETSIQSHMNLINQEVNNSLTKMVTSINQKIYKALQNNLTSVNEKLKKNFLLCKVMVQENKNKQNILKPNNIEGKTTFSKGICLKQSGFKTDANSTRIKIQSILTLMNAKNNEKINTNGDQKVKSEQNQSKWSTAPQQFVLGGDVYYIDPDGYLLDENHVYLLDQNNHLLQLQADKLNRIKQFT